jgi:type 1 glutamine amidotransferase
MNLQGSPRTNVPRRRFLGAAATLGLSSSGSWLLRAQTPPTSAPTEPVSAPIRLSQDLAKLVQVQVLIGNGVDYEFLRMFDGFADLNIRVSPSPAAFQNLMPDPAAATPGRGPGLRRRPTDVIVLYDQIYDMPEESQQNVRRYVEAGKGIVVLHNALTDYQRWPFWYRDVVGGAYTIRDAGMPKVFAGTHEHGPIDDVVINSPSSSPDKMVSPGVWDFQEYLIRPVGSHPVLTGVQAFTVRDEKYKDMWMSDKIVPILQTDDPASDKIIGWIGPHPKAKVFAIILGHSVDSHAHPMYRRIVRNAILWAGGRLT